MARVRWSNSVWGSLSCVCLAGRQCARTGSGIGGTVLRVSFFSDGRTAGYRF